MTFDDSALSDVLRDPCCAAEQSAQPIVLYVSNNVPVELITASGCFALHLPTAPLNDYARADHYLEPGFEPMVRAALQQLLTGELRRASLLILPRTIDAWQRLYYYLCELRRRFGEHLPEPFLYDLQQLPTAPSALYNEHSTQRLADKLQALTGRRLTHAALAESIALYNQLRDALQRLRQLRSAQPCGLRGAHALDLYTAIQRLDPRTALAVLDARVANPGPTAQGTRTLLVGSGHDTPTLHHMVDAAGGQVVLDFHFRGDWFLGPSVPEPRVSDSATETTTHAIKALGQHYHKHTLSTRSAPRLLEALLDSASRCRAQAAIFFYYAEEEALTWDYPAQAAALRARGIATLLLERQPYPPAADAEARLRDFYRANREDREP